MPLVRIGHLGRTHGVHGELYLDGAALTPLELHGVKRFTWRKGGAVERPLTLHTARPALNRLLVRFEGVDTREQAVELTNGELWAPPETLPDPGPGTVYTFQLLGLRVATAEGRDLGVLEEVVSTGANPVYAVRGERELLIPASPGVVQRVDLEAGVMVVALPEGLEDL